MKKYLLSSIRLTLVLLVVLCMVYPLLIAGIARFAKGEGGGEKVLLKGKVVGYAAVGQKFDSPRFFWGRPSAVDYNAAGSAGSNKGPANPAYLDMVSRRIDTLLKYHPYLKRSEVPSDMVTASGSGLDPDISVQGAEMQVKRVAAWRKISESLVAKLVSEHTDKPFFGPAKVNVLALNIALEQLN